MVEMVRAYSSIQMVVNLFRIMIYFLSVCTSGLILHKKNIMFMNIPFRILSSNSDENLITIGY